MPAGRPFAARTPKHRRVMSATRYQTRAQRQTHPRASGVMSDLRRGIYTPSELHRSTRRLDRNVAAGRNHTASGAPLRISISRAFAGREKARQALSAEMPLKPNGVEHEQLRHHPQPRSRLRTTTRCRRLRTTPNFKASQFVRPRLPPARQSTMKFLLSAVTARLGCRQPSPTINRRGWHRER